MWRTPHKFIFLSYVNSHSKRYVLNGRGNTNLVWTNELGFYVARIISWDCVFVYHYFLFYIDYMFSSGMD